MDFGSSSASLGTCLWMNQLNDGHFWPYKGLVDLGPDDGWRLAELAKITALQFDRPLA
jgi:hypothetical protein